MMKLSQILQIRKKGEKNKSCTYRPTEIQSGPNEMTYDPLNPNCRLQ